jgi:hypothetical protein
MQHTAEALRRSFPEGANIRITNENTGKVTHAVVEPHGTLTPTAKREDGGIVILGILMEKNPWLMGPFTVEVV